MALTVGSPAPDFALSDQTNTMHTLHALRGKWVLLYFYPKDDTPGCTTQACDIRDRFSEFQREGISVFGISGDSIESHQKFSSKFSLPFPLLSDESKETIKAYQAWGPKSFMGKQYEGIFRTSYLINPEGILTAVFPKVDPQQHVEQILKAKKSA